MVDTSALAKSDLCKALRWSKPRLDRRLESDPNFPVRTRGTQAGGWQFDLPTVLAYLESAPKVKGPGRPPKTVAQEQREVQAPVAPPAPTGHFGEATAKQRRDQAQAAILEDKLRRDRGELLEAEEVRVVISNMLVRFGKGLDNLPDQVIQRLTLPADRIDALRDITDGLRRAMITDLKTLMAPGASPAAQ